MSEITISTMGKEEIEKAKGESVKIIEHAKTLANAIADDPTMQVAVDFTFHIRKMRKEWEAYNKPEKDQVNKLKQVIMDRIREVDEPLERAEEAILKPAIQRYQSEKERQRKAEEARLLAEARKREEDRRLEEAANLEKAGRKQEAQALIETPASVAAPILPKSKPEGGTFRTDWDFRITDPNLVPREYMMLDLVKIRRAVVMWKGQTNIPGVEVFDKPVLVQGRS